MDQDVLICLIVFGSFVAIIRTIADTMTRNRLISSGLVDERTKHLWVGNPLNNVLSSLKWGMVLVAIGLAAMIGQIWSDYLEDEAILGLVFVMAGIAFLIYYPLAQRKLKEFNRQTTMP